VLATISSILRNAFVSAFARSLEGSINLRDVKKNLQDADPHKDEKESSKDRDADEKLVRKTPPGPAGKT